MVSTAPGVDAVRSALVRLRTRSGLSAERLRSTEVGVVSLLDLPAVRQMVGNSGSAAPEAAVEAIRQFAGQLSATDLVIVDAVLALGVLGERFPANAEISELYAANVGDRRQQLVDQWDKLHRLLGVVPSPKQPTVRALRSSVETRAIARLAALCVSDSLLNVVVSGQSAHPANTPDGPTVVVIGSAVMDLMFAVDHVPTAGTSTPASEYTPAPGGKGLNHAVASARLGMNVQFIAALGDDHFGSEVLEYMTGKGLGLNLLKVTPEAKNPVVVVMMTPEGVTSYFAWSNENNVRLDPADLRSHAAKGTLEAADAIVVTFEPPVETISAALEIAGRQAKKPVVVVRPSPPIPDPQQLYREFPNIDYLVGTERELRELLRSDQAVTVEQLATSLLMLGVRGICMTTGFGCMIRSEHINADIAGLPAAMRDTPGAREAFSAALVHRLMEKNGKIDRKDLEWATAAMTAAQSFEGAAESMPTPEKIDRVLSVAPGEAVRT